MLNQQKPETTHKLINAINNDNGTVTAHFQVTVTNQFGQPGVYSAAITAKTLEEAEQRLIGSPQPAHAGATPETRRKFPAEAYRA